ncbi:MAG: hypothetical protein Q9P14_10320 [candidate division KSB1 bacterium]|nr:hypothetical protein [candidate division KSB1 bacterium]
MERHLIIQLFRGGFGFSNIGARKIGVMHHIVFAAVFWIFLPGAFSACGSVISLFEFIALHGLMFCSANSFEQADFAGQPLAVTGAFFLLRRECEIHAQLIPARVPALASIPRG